MSIEGGRKSFDAAAQHKLTELFGGKAPVFARERNGQHFINGLKILFSYATHQSVELSLGSGILGGFLSDLLRSADVIEIKSLPENVFLAARKRFTGKQLVGAMVAEVPTPAALASLVHYPYALNPEMVAMLSEPGTRKVFLIGIADSQRPQSVFVVPG